MATVALFSATELSDWLGKTVSAEKSAAVEKVVWGWLRPRIGSPDVRPDPVTPELFSWAVELGAIAHENPAGLSAKSLGDKSVQFSSERRDEILELASGGGQSPRPRGNFPPAPCYPDPAQPYPRGGVYR